MTIAIADYDETTIAIPSIPQCCCWLAFVLAVLTLRLQPRHSPAAWLAQPPALGARPRHLRPGHPRLLVLDDDLAARARALAPRPASARGATQLRAARRAHARRARRRAGAGRAPVAPQSRAALDRITTLAGLFLLDGDPRDAGARQGRDARGRRAWPDWNPSHFLDVAEMTAAMALGYDWLYSTSRPRSARVFRPAIVNKGLGQAVRPSRQGAFWAAEGRNTWSEVCFGGLALGALAVAEHAPAGRLRCWAPSRGRALRVASGPLCARRRRRRMGPATGATRRSTSTLLLAALETALGEDFGLGQPTGWPRPGNSGCTRSGPAAGSSTTRMRRSARRGAADALAGRPLRPARVRRARTGVDGAVARAAEHLPPALERRASHAHGDGAADVGALPRHRRRGARRGDWRDPHASWVGAARGAATPATRYTSTWAASSSTRWASAGRSISGPRLLQPAGVLRSAPVDLLPPADREPQHALSRWPQPGSAATAPIVAFSDDGYRAFAVADLTAAYRPALTRVRRGVALIDGRDVLIQDEIDGGRDRRRRVADGHARAGDRSRPADGAAPERALASSAGARAGGRDGAGGAAVGARAAGPPDVCGPASCCRRRAARSASSSGSRPAIGRRRRHAARCVAMSAST